MYKFFVIFLIVLSIKFAENQSQILRASVDYTKAVNWDRRELECKASPDGKTTGKCSLYIGKENSKAEKAECREENISTNEVRSLCDIKCVGADRDSVISKFPNNNHRCIRFYTYNTEQDDRGRWFIWRSGQCRLEEISLEVHCGFP